MLDIRFVRGQPEIVRKYLQKRQQPELIEWFNDLLEKDKRLREQLQRADVLRHKRNVLTEEINQLKRQGKDISAKLKEAKNIPDEIKKIEQSSKELEGKVNFYLMRLPNVLHESVPFGKDSNDNKIIKKVGKPPKFSFPVKHHGELAVELGLADFERARKISGTGFYFLKGDLALMDLALQRFAIDELMKKGYQYVFPPHMMRREAYEGVTSLDDFETVMYKIENEDEYLIATAEHPLIAMHMNEIFDEKDLPIKYVSFSTNFRKEIGAHGLDERGLFRLHQFGKVEHVIFCKPEDSWKHFNELISNAESLFKKLGLHFRIVDICTGDIGIVAAKKNDIEAWSPREKKYFEVHSGSNCTSYQAVRSNIKFRKKNSMDKEYVHTLNSTAIATQRALRAIIENYQTKKGTIKVPRVLQKYMNGLKEIKKQ